MEKGVARSSNVRLLGVDTGAAAGEAIGLREGKEGPVFNEGTNVGVPFLVGAVEGVILGPSLDPGGSDNGGVGASVSVPEEGVGEMVGVPTEGVGEMVGVPAEGVGEMVGVPTEGVGEMVGVPAEGVGAVFGVANGAIIVGTILGPSLVPGGKLTESLVGTLVSGRPPDGAGKSDGTSDG